MFANQTDKNVVMDGNEGALGKTKSYQKIASDAQSWTALFRAFSSHRQPSASLTKLFPSWTRLLAELNKP